MTRDKLRAAGLIACGAWVVVAAYGVRELLVVDDDDWELAYAVLEVALLVGVALATVVVAAMTRGSGRRGLRAVGLGVTGLGAALAVVGAWAVVLWSGVLALGYGMVALAAAPSERRWAATLSGAQVAGLATLGLVIALGDGERAVDIELVVTAASAAAGLGALLLDPGRLAATAI